MSGFLSIEKLKGIINVDSYLSRPCPALEPLEDVCIRGAYLQASFIPAAWPSFSAVFIMVADRRWSKDSSYSVHEKLPNSLFEIVLIDTQKMWKF